MQLAIIDWLIIIAFFAVSIGIGVWASRSAGKSFKDYFLAGGKMSWWLLGVSMVATTFAADTPGLVTQLVRQGGVSGNWAWWAFLLTGLLTVFVYGKTSAILAMVAATFLVYSLLFGVGYFLYSQMLYAGISAVIAVVSTLAIAGIWPRLKMGKST